MAAFTKTAGTSVLTHQAVTHPATVQGSVQDVSTKMFATVYLFHALVEATANTNAGRFMVMGSANSSGDEDWGILEEVRVTTATPATEAMTATEPVAETVLAVASTTGFAAEDVLYIQDTTTVGDSEWAYCEQIVTNTSIDLIDGLTNAKDSADVIWNEAQVIPVQLNLAAISRIKVIFQHEGTTGANAHVKAMMVTGDSFA